MINQQFPIQEHTYNGYLFSTNPAKIDLDVIYTYLSQESYWANGRSQADIAKRFRFAYCWGVYHPDSQQVGFARAVTDFITFAYISDVFILRPFQGQGLGKQLMHTILNDSHFADVSRWTLYTDDAHGLYEAYGFKRNPDPDTYMSYVLQKRS